MMRFQASTERSTGRGEPFNESRAYIMDGMCRIRSGLVIDLNAALAVIECIKAEGFNPSVKEREVFEHQTTFLLE